MEKTNDFDIIDVCKLLQASGFKIKDVYKEQNIFEERIGKTVELRCNSSGVKVVLETKSFECSCPKFEDNDAGEKWEMSGTSGGKQISKAEKSSSFHDELTNNIAVNIKDEITKLIKLARKPSKDIVSPPKKPNMSVSSSCLNVTPPRMDPQIKIDTPSRYRSLDTLSTVERPPPLLPEPRMLSSSQKSLIVDSNLNVDRSSPKDEITKSGKKKTVVRQNTYTASPPDNEKAKLIPSRTSSPVQKIPDVVMFNLHHAEKIAEELTSIIQESINAIKKDIDIEDRTASVMNVSKISNIKRVEPIKRSASVISTISNAPYASSPNLSRIQEAPKALSANSKRRLSYKVSPNEVKKELKCSSLKRSIPKRISSVSPTFGLIGSKKSSSGTGLLGSNLLGSYKTMPEKGMGNSSARKSFSSTPQLSETKKKTSLYGHIKSTIPRHITSKK